MTFAQTAPVTHHHDVDLYQTEEAFYASVSEHLAAGLLAGESLVLIATPEHRDGLLARLRSLCFDVDGLCAGARLIQLDARDTLDEFMRDGRPDPQLFKSRVGALLDKANDAAPARCVRAFGEMVALLWADGNPPGALALEELWNELAQAHLFKLLCAYPASIVRGDDLALRRVYATHRHFSHTAASEKHFRLLVESVKDYAIFMLDKAGHIASWNPGAERLKGYRADEIIGEHFSIFYPEEEARSGKCERELEEALNVGRFEEEGWRLRKDGTPFWANVVITAVFDDQGKHTGFAKVTRDLTERKRATERLMEEREKRAREQAARQRAEENLRNGELFIGVLGHDLRNPLSATVTAAQLILRSDDAERRKRSAQRIISSGMRMGRMIDQLLDLTRIRLGEGLAIVRGPMDLGALASEISDENIEAQIVFERAGEMLGRWDRDRLAQALTNLVANAVQHGTRGRPVRLFVDGRGQEVEVSVHNDGSMPAEQLPRAFEPFKRGTEARPGGLGLGLYITREIIRAHGGSIAVTSSPEDGTTFSFRLPR